MSNSKPKIQIKKKQPIDINDLISKTSIELINNITLPLNDDTILIDNTMLVDDNTIVVDDNTMIVDDNTIVVDDNTMLVDDNTMLVDDNITILVDKTLENDDPPLPKMKTLVDLYKPRKPPTTTKLTKVTSKRTNTFVKSDQPPMNRLHKISDFPTKLERFQKMPKYEQKSQGWLDQRSNYLTASTIYHACATDKTNVARRDLLLNKVSMGKYNTFFGNSATHWGNKYEPVANAIYSFRNQTEIHEFGMITNDKYPFLGVSPDGILADRMLEIKCPYSRVIDGKVKNEYYHQMQEQMIVCEYDMCDFLECKFQEIPIDHFWIDFDYYTDEKGIILSYIDLDELNTNEIKLNANTDEVEFKEVEFKEIESITPKYLYSPIEYHNDIDKLQQWVKTQLIQFQENDVHVYIQTMCWTLVKYNCQLVYRSDDWIPYYYPILEDFWSDVIKYRELGFEYLQKEIETEKQSQLSDDIDDTIYLPPPKFKQCLLD